MLKFGNKEFNNLQEQVLENANDILEIKQSLGAALPNPIAGPQGVQGPVGATGPQGTRGSLWTVGTELPASANNGDIHLKFNGEVYIYNNGWILSTSILGPQGVQGPRGLQGPQGVQGPVGATGPQGTTSPIYSVQGILTDISQLPSPDTLPTNYAYIIDNNVYGIVGGEWEEITSLVSYANANQVAFTPTEDIASTNVQSAIAEVSHYAKTLTASDIFYDNSDSGLNATNVQSAIDEAYRLEQNTNLLNPETILFNHYVWDGTEVGTTAYDVTDFIKVNEGDVITYQETLGGTRNIYSMRFVNAFDENKQTLNNLSATTIESYTVPSGVKWIRVSYSHRSAADLENYKTAIVNSAVVIPYEEYWKKTYIKNSLIDENFIKNIINEENNNLKINIEQCNFANTINLFDKTSSDILIGKYVYEGVISENPSYDATGFIEVEPNTQYAFFTSSSLTGTRFVDEYDENKQYISGTAKSNATTITTNANTKYIRCSFYASGLDEFTIIKGAVVSQYIPYGYKIDREYLRLDDATSVLAFLPKDIYVAVGRTIELYNEQVVLQADKYHFRWQCQIGKGLKRKFSVEGLENQIGDYPLTLSLINDDFDVVWSGTSTLHIVPAFTGSTVSICPIGDSLTNGKYWLNEVRNLSGQWIRFVGTRGTEDGLKHEGRSGWSTIQYLSNAEYTYEQPATPNPFWFAADNEFSWLYYKGTYSIYPNIVQIFLGTNDLLALTKEQFATNIKTMIDSIRGNDANIPIMLVLTLCWGNQNGIGVQTSTDGFAALSGYYKYKQDEIIIAGTKYLEEFIKEQNYTGIYFVPLVSCHDSENNFGAVPTLVNPRASAAQIELMPIEAVHPQKQGYEQFADVMYSVISYIKSL